MDRTSCFKCEWLKCYRVKENGNLFFYCIQNKKVVGKFLHKRKFAAKPKPIKGVPCKPREKGAKKPSMFRRIMNWLTRNKGTRR